MGIKPYTTVEQELVLKEFELLVRTPEGGEDVLLDSYSD